MVDTGIGSEDVIGPGERWFLAAVAGVGSGCIVAWSWGLGLWIAMPENDGLKRAGPFRDPIVTEVMTLFGSFPGIVMGSIAAWRWRPMTYRGFWSRALKVDLVVVCVTFVVTIANPMLGLAASALAALLLIELFRPRTALP